MCNQQSLRSACAYAQSDQSLCKLLEYSMTVYLLTEQHFEFPSLKGGCTCSSEPTLVKIPNCWKSQVVVHISITSSQQTHFQRTTKICFWQYAKFISRAAHTRWTQNTISVFDKWFFFYMFVHCCEQATQPYCASYSEMEGEVGFTQAQDQQGRLYWCHLYSKPLMYRGNIIKP